MGGVVFVSLRLKASPNSNRNEGLANQQYDTQTECALRITLDVEWQLVLNRESSLVAQLVFDSPNPFSIRS
eukprot:734656-Amphidinium_carterae.1